ncbi:MAG: RHS repeat domain-containing protein [Pleurocapsa sp.]
MEDLTYRDIHSKSRVEGYELTNHLGNVLATVSDRKQKVDTIGTQGQADYYEPVILSATDYYPFGLDMPGRMMSSEDYRRGGNGKEADRNKEWGGGVHYDYGFRIYDPGIGKFLSVDPLAASYPYYTPYQFAGNSVIENIDLDGLEKFNYRLLLDKTGECIIDVEFDEKISWWSSGLLNRNTHRVINPETQVLMEYEFS